MKRTRNMVYIPSDEARELFLSACSDGDLYRVATIHVINNLKKKVKKGVFDSDKAIDAFYHIATLASKNYNRDFGYMFNVTERFTAAADMVDYYMDHIMEDDDEAA